MTKKKPRKKTAVVKTPPKPTPKPTPEQVIQVKTWIIEGQQAGDILESIAENYPDQTPQSLMSAAFDGLIQESANIDEDLVRGFLLNAHRELYRRALKVNDFKAAIAALKAFEGVTLN